MGGDPAEGLAEVVGAIYAAGMAPERWPAVLEQTAAQFGARVGMLWTHDFSDNSIYRPNDQLSCMVGLDAAGVAAFKSHHYATNVWVPRSAHLEEGQTVLSSQLYPESDLPRTEFHADWLRPNDLHHAIGSSVMRAASRQVKLSFVRPRRAGAFDDSDRRRLAFLLPHVRNAFVVHKQLAEVRALADSLTAALDRLAVGVVLLGADERVIHSNVAARDVIERTRALDLSGLVSCATPRQGVELRRLIAGAVQTAKGAGLHRGGAMKLRGAGGEMQVMVVPLDPSAQHGLSGSACVMFCFGARDVSPQLVGAWRSLHGFTDAEAEVASLFFQGLPPEEIAMCRETSVNTVRAQLKGIYWKTGTHRQADLVRKLAESLLLVRQ